MASDAAGAAGDTKPKEVDPLDAVPWQDVCQLLSKLQAIKGKKAREKREKLLSRFHREVIQHYAGTKNWYCHARLSSLIIVRPTRGKPSGPHFSPSQGDEPCAQRCVHGVPPHHTVLRPSSQRVSAQGGGAAEARMLQKPQL